jgi:hypoxia up-regulated 1
VLNEFAVDDRGLVAFQSFSLKDADEKTIYYTEEIVGQILKYGRTLSEKAAEGNVHECVITIPSYFGQEQRRMMMDAAEIAGLKVIALIHENVAAATMFGVDRLDETPLNVLYYNMGASNTEVTIARYSSVLEEDKKKPVEQIEILAETYDSTLGGNEWDHVLVQILVDKFNNLPERKGKADVRENPRAMKRLYKEAINVKDILSANKIADVKVPELVDYVTLRTIVSRQEFEEKSEHLFSRVAKPVSEALAKAGLTTSDIA